MPTYRSINIALHSQFDVQTLPEYYPLPQEHYTSQGAAQATPKYIDDASSTCSVYVPVLPGSTFWIGYSVSPPVPAGHYFLFKLYINGVHIINFSTGKEDGWKGKTMFGLYGRPEGEDGKGTVEKRVLAFTSPSDKDKGWDDVGDAFDEQMCMELRVHRAHGRKRVEREMEQYKETQHAQQAKGVSLVNAGRASSEQPKRFYKFALTDPVDQPFARFKYYYRTWDQLHSLGLLDDDDENEAAEDNMSVIEPCGASDGGVEGAKNSRASDNDAEDVFYECGKATSPVRVRKPSMSEASQRSSTLEQRRAYVPSGMRTPPQSHRLSVPPSITLDPPSQHSRPLPTAPHKTSETSSVAHHPHAAYLVDEWRVRTPSPVKSVREGITTPPMEKRGDRLQASSLMSALASTLKRRGTPSADSHGSGSGARSAT